MKVGMIFECGPAGADIHVCEYLVKEFFPEVELAASVPLDNKPNLLMQCGVVAATMLAEGCDRVVIVWDLHPAWREDHAKPCRKDDRNKAIESLKSAGVSPNTAFLVCVEEELEAWLLADGRALSNYLTRDTRSVKVDDEKRPDRVRKPKTHLSRIMERNGAGRYSDRIHAVKIAREIPDLSRLRRSPTFERFILKVTGQPLI